MSKFYTHISSPNYEERASGTSLEFLIMHYTACDLKTSLQVLTDPQAPSRVSSHYLIDENGDVFRLVDERYRAWHAGESSWKGLTDINSRSIGIELVNPGMGPDYRAFPQAQMESLLDLSKDIIKRYSIPGPYVLGHSDIAPQRKVDPGPLFDWRWLAQRGVGFYPQWRNSFPEACEENGDISYLQELLGCYGYAIEKTGLWDVQTQRVIRAFQMHFWPESLEKKVGKSLVQRLEKLTGQGASFVIVGLDPRIP